MIENIKKLDEAIISVLLFLISFNILMPIAGLILDFRAYKSVKENKQRNFDDISDEILKGIAKELGIPFEIVIYQRY